MPHCAVLTCKSKSRGTNGPERGLSFHMFPVDPELKAKWVDMTGRDNWSPNETSMICSKHFRDNDYFIKRSGKRYLKITAIPCEYVVYRHLFPAENSMPTPASQVDEENREAAAAVTPPTVITATVTSASAQEADTTSYNEDLNDNNDNNIGWEQFETLRYYGRSLGPAQNVERPPSELQSSAANNRDVSEWLESVGSAPQLRAPVVKHKDPSEADSTQRLRKIKKLICKRKIPRKV